jgi:hypothetical protein
MTTPEVTSITFRVFAFGLQTKINVGAGEELRSGDERERE